MSLAVKKYVSALVEVALENKCLDRVYDEFKAVDEELSSNEEFAKFLQMDIVTSHDKKALFEKSLANGSKYLLNFIKLLIDKEHMDEFHEMFIEFEDMYKEQQNIIEATAVTAIELSEADIASITEMLAKKYDKTVVLTTQVDPSILGGMMLYVDNTLLDASLRSKLSGLKNALKQIKFS